MNNEELEEKLEGLAYEDLLARHMRLLWELERLVAWWRMQLSSILDDAANGLQTVIDEAKEFDGQRGA